MSAYALELYDATTQVGTIRYDSLAESFTFGYADEWRDNETSYAISPHFKLDGQAPSSNTIRRFIENLLPEGRALDIVSTTLRVSKNNVFALIRALGSETTGALTFLPEGQRPEARPSARREISRAELSRRIAERNLVPFAVWDDKVRLSIAGHQDKLAAFIQDGRIFLVEGALASTHILKPEPIDERLPMLVANEHFCMRLAANLGLPVARVGILRVPEPVLVVERFDRVAQDQQVTRRHVVDACQALDLPASYKYERNFGAARDVRHIRDGVSLPRLFSTIDHAAEKALTSQLLLRWVLFQYLIGNADAHGKNVSFFCRHEGLALSPFYDLVSVVQYPNVDHGLAMAVGDAFAFDDVSPFSWAEFAQQADVPRETVVREMRRLAKAASTAIREAVHSSDYTEAEQAFVAQISEFVQAQAAKLSAMATPTKAVSAQFLGGNANALG